MSEIIKIIKNNYIPIILFSLALLLRSVALNVPYIKFDEDAYVILATHILEDPLNPLFPDPNIWKISSGPLFPYILALIMYMFGDPYVSTRIVVAIIGSISILVTYFFGKRLFGKTVATMTGLLMIVNPEHWSISMQAITDMLFLLLFLCSLYFIYIGIEENKNKMLILGGILASLATITRYPGILIIPIFFLYLLLTGRLRYFIKLPFLVSIVFLPSLMLLLWSVYLSIYEGDVPSGISLFMTFNSAIPRYEFLGNISLVLLLGVFPLALFPYIHIFKNYFSNKKYIGMLILFYIFTILILKLLLPKDILLYDGYSIGVIQTIKSILNSSILFSLTKLFLYFFSILAMVGFFIEVYVGSKHKRNEYTLLACWVVMMLIFVAILPISFPRYLLPVIPAFLMVISLEIESFSKINKISKLLSYLVFIAIMLIYLTVGLFKVVLMSGIDIN